MSQQLTDGICPREGTFRYGAGQQLGQILEYWPE